MPVSELAGWAKYLSLEPWNSVEIQSALIATVANNAVGGKAKLDDMLVTQHKKPKTLEDIISSRPTADQVKAAFGAFIYK